MLPAHLGQPDHCSKCGRLQASSELIYEGAELTPVCLSCMRQLDPARAALLEKIQQRRQPPSP